MLFLVVLELYILVVNQTLIYKKSILNVHNEQFDLVFCVSSHSLGQLPFSYGPDRGLADGLGHSSSFKADRESSDTPLALGSSSRSCPRPRSQSGS